MSQILASIQKIVEVSPLIGPDGIEAHSVAYAKVLGWDLVVEKGAFAAGDFCVFFEIGSVVPFEQEPFLFMKSTKGRVKSREFLKNLSQGLALPLNKFDPSIFVPPLHLKEGIDVSQALGIVKYIPPSERESNGPNNQSHRKSSFPTHLCPQTDQKRIQSVPSVIQELAGKRCEITVKCDGSSSSFGWDGNEYYVCSRNQTTYDEERNLWWQLSRKHDIERKLKEKGQYFIQGELLAPSVQKNRHGVKDPMLAVFDVYNVLNHRYLDFADLLSFCQELELPMVPILDDNFILNHTMNELVALADGQYSNGHPREGVVIKTYEEITSRILKGRASFKIISNKFLLKIGE